MRCLVVSLVLVSLGVANLLPKEKGCGEPDLPLHSTYRCEPTVCQGVLDSGVFAVGTRLEYYCQPGYALSSLPGIAICRRGEWHLVQEVLCAPQGTSLAPQDSDFSLFIALSLAAGVLVLLKALILWLALCSLVLRALSSPCRCASQPYETLEEPDMFVMVDMDEPGTNRTEVPLPLPSYEEAVYGHNGAPVASPHLGLMPLILSAQTELSDGSRVPGGSLDEDDPPPSYQEAMAAAATTAKDAPEREPAASWPTSPSFPLER